LEEVPYREEAPSCQEASPEANPYPVVDPFLEEAPFLVVDPFLEEVPFLEEAHWRLDADPCHSFSLQMEPSFSLFLEPFHRQNYATRQTKDISRQISLSLSLCGSKKLVTTSLRAVARRRQMEGC
jgi:hypothetical protein